MPNLKKPGQEAVICNRCNTRIDVDKDVIQKMNDHVERCGA